MTPKLILSSKGTLKYVAEWPDEPNVTLTCNENCDGSCGDVCPVIRSNRIILDKYDRRVLQAIANAVPFKNKDEDIEIKRLIFDSIPPIEDVRSFSEWKMEPLKPYALPEGIEIEIKEEMSPRIKINNETKGAILQKFAFIKKQPDRNDETQDDLWWIVAKSFQRPLAFFIDDMKSSFRIERIKK